MPDPFTIIGVTAALIDLTVFAGKIVRAAYNAHETASTMTPENEKLEYAIGHLDQLMDKLQAGSATSQDPGMVELTSHCQSLGQKIVARLKKTKVKDSQSSRQCIRAAIKTVWVKKDIDELKKELDFCTSQLSLYVQSAMLSDVGVKMEEILKENWSAAADFARLKGAVDRVGERQEDALSMLHKVGKLLDRSQEHLIEANRRRILDGIQFQNMDARFESIVTASKDTFLWCVEDSEIPDSHPNLAISFRDWLATGSGVFHIAGKPGAGKSTLMKFLAEHPETKSQLQAWAGPSKTLVLASFYFWRAGHCDQRSLEGLVRSILHTLLGKLPHLIPGLFPEYWNPGNPSIIYPGTEATKKIHFDQVLLALDRVLKRDIDTKNYSFCFFIDGLDEFDDPNEKHSMLARRLGSWTTSNPASLKICVSSRQELAFMDNFSEQQRLYIHFLTRKDMEIAASNTLEKHPNFLAMSGTEQESLIDSIVKRGEGVFLWVKLVLDEIWEALDENSNFDEMCRLLNTFPDELEAFFGFILLAIRKRYRKEGWAVLTVLSTTTGTQNVIRRPMTLYLTQFTFIVDYLDNKSFGMLREVESSHQEAKARIQIRNTSFARRINNLCKGLVEAVPYNVGLDLGRLNLIHRSVIDYLQGGSVPKEFQTFKQAIDVESFVIQSFIALFRLVCPIIQQENPNSFFSLNFGMAPLLQEFLRWVALRSEDLTEEHYEQLGVLDQTILEIEHKSTNITVPDWNQYFLLGTKSLFEGAGPPTKRYIYYLLADACRIHFVGYVTWAFRNRPGIASHPETLSMLVNEAMNPLSSAALYQGSCNGAVLAFFAKQLWFTPALVVATCNDNDWHSHLVLPAETPGQARHRFGMSVWLGLITRCVTQNWSRNRHDWLLHAKLWELLKLCLQHDDGSCALNFNWVVQRKSEERSCLTIMDISDSAEVDKTNIITREFVDNDPTPERDNICFLEFPISRPIRNSPRPFYFLDFPISRPMCPLDDETLLAGKSFRWLIEQSDREDRDELLALIDRNIRLTRPPRAAALKALLLRLTQTPGKFGYLFWAFIFSSLFGILLFYLFYRL